MKIDTKYLQFGWFDASPDEAVALDLEQYSRWHWQVFVIMIFGIGITLWARVKP